MGWMLVAAAAILAEIQYRRHFRVSLHELVDRVSHAHEEELKFRFSRFGKEIPSLDVSLMEDFFEASRIRLPWTPAKSGRLGLYGEGARSTAYAYFAVEVTHVVSGEWRRTQMYLLEPAGSLLCSLGRI